MEMNGFCKACLVLYEDPMELLLYTEKNRRLFLYSTGLQVKPNDTVPFQLCQTCFLKMKMACQFKKQCRTSDKRLSHFLTLKEAGEAVDFTIYLQNNEGPALFKFPLNGTPPFQKTKEDDNVSTSTSIRNFMTDFLREDEVPDTEAHIIKEMIEQEADVLDDSLDSQWLQEDISIASDFRFSPFSTPLPKHNYQPLLNYSPIKNEPPDENKIQNSNKRNILAAKKLHLTSVSSSSGDDSPSQNSNHDTFTAAKRILLNTKSNTRSQVKPEQNDQESYIAKKRMLLTNNLSNKQMIQKGKDIETHLAAKSILQVSNSDASENENQETTDTNQGLRTPKGFYIENMEPIRFCINGIEVKRDSIDKNLEKILNNTNDDVISLSALLRSPSSEAQYSNGIISTPSVHRGLSGANTPTIANILFGEKLDEDKNSIKPNCDNDNNNVDILEDFFNKETGAYIGDKNINQDEIFEEYKGENALAMPGKSQFDLTDFSCKKCNVKYKNERGLKVHFMRKHKSKIITQRTKEPKIEIPCDRCGKIFNLKSNLRRHIKVMHLKPKPAQRCKLCSLEFVNEAKLNLHMKSHGEKPKHVNKKKLNLVCPICGHVSTQVSNLNIHIARHNKQYAFTCDPCGRGFYRKSDLQIHIRLHMDSKPFKCPICPVSVRRKDQLQIHLKRHTGERPFVCEICNKKFATSSKVKAHMNISETCKKMRHDAAIKANKEIEESIDQLYVAETSVQLGNEDIRKDENLIAPKVSKNAKTVASNKDSCDNDKQVNIKDLPFIVVKDDGDKVSLSEMFTIPAINKDEI